MISSHVGWHSVDLLKIYPNSNYLENAYAWIACFENDRDKVKQLFEKLGKNWNQEIWGMRPAYDIRKRWDIVQTKIRPDLAQKQRQAKRRRKRN